MNRIILPVIGFGLAKSALPVIIVLPLIFIIVFGFVTADFIKSL